MPSHYEVALMSDLAYEFSSASKKLLMMQRDNTDIFQDKKNFYTIHENNYNYNDDLRFLFCSPHPNESLRSSQNALFLHDHNWSVYTTSDRILPELPQLEEHLNILLYGYFAVAFINRNSSEIVIAHRGTIVSLSDSSTGKNIRDDIQILKGQNCEEMPKVLDCALGFITQIIRQRDEDSHLANFKLFQTGHSLGGFLAEFGAAYIAHPRPVLEGQNWLEDYRRGVRLTNPCPDDANAITFDSLGSQFFLQYFGIQLNRDSSSPTVNYMLKPNIANTANIQDGERRQLFMNENAATQAAIQTQFSSQSAVNLATLEIANIEDAIKTSESHSLVKFIEHFDPQTGVPYSYRVILSWPVARNRFFRSENPPINISPAVSGMSWPEFFIYMGAMILVIIAHNLSGGVIQAEHTREGAVSYHLSQENTNVVLNQQSETLTLNNNQVTSFGNISMFEITDQESIPLGSGNNPAHLFPPPFRNNNRIFTDINHASSLPPPS